jgi:2-polyprenyl-6-methoxyphenol hydroxylase-like FAD-dependent oxidoreductase
MQQPKKVLIVGGGIGGLTAAIALKQQGIDSEIVEINPAWSVYGVGIIQPSNALRVLMQIGLGESCVANGFGFPGWRICDSQGNRLADVESKNIAGKGYPPINGITRPTLHKILTETTLKQGTPVRLGITVDRSEDGPAGINVQFTDGSRGAYDLVVAADGTYSEIRSNLFEPHLKPKFTGEVVWRYNFERPRDMMWGQIFYGAKSKAGLVPLTDRLMYIFLVTMEPGNPRMPQDQLHELLRDRLSEYGGIVARLRDHVTDPKAVVYRPMETILVPTPWHRGRVVLIGDAAHSSTPHLAEGAAMAIEDAVLLAQLLGQARELDATLGEFAARRMPRCRLVMETGLKLGEWEMAEWQGRRAPDTDHGGLMHRSLSTLMEPI